jgi:hypothetical protein
VDALDTMIIMGFNEEVARARAHIAKLNFDVSYDVSFFETSIRYCCLLFSFHISHYATATTLHPSFVSAKSTNHLTLSGVG